jgi:(1->4)-alpha-D-glucan 1-alpha-D-glucosylmutase
VRARINILSEMPDEWRECVTQWSDINRHQGGPTRNDEYLVYQTLVGAWPADDEPADETFVRRIQAYMQKALREAKVNTSWTSPNAEYESAVEQFVARTIANPAFRDSFLPFQRRVAELAMTNTLAQTLLRLTVPGVPDTYQGTELLDLSLVDPDNRRPVDYQRRLRLLDQPESDRKFIVTTRTLHARRDHLGLFSRGEYTPLEASGSKAAHVFAFERKLGVQHAVVIVPRLVTPIGNWDDTTIRLPKIRGRDVFTGKSVSFGGKPVPVGVLLNDFPVALLLADT